MTIRIAGLAVLGLLATAQVNGTHAQTAPAAGANSFTEGQARGRIEEAGYAAVTALRKDEQGVWRGRATRNGTPTDVALDFRGSVLTGAAATAPAVETDEAANRAAPDGTGPGGNPSGTAAGRAADRAAGTNATGINPGGTAPDGTAGNPPGTAAGRAVDRTLGTNATGANPTGANPGGTTAAPAR